MWDNFVDLAIIIRSFSVCSWETLLCWLVYKGDHTVFPSSGMGALSFPAIPLPSPTIPTVLPDTIILSMSECHRAAVKCEAPQAQ